MPFKIYPKWDFWYKNISTYYLATRVKNKSPKVFATYVIKAKCPK
jgi:hypothetical protein